MAHGGARNRSGPPPDPRSGRSEQRGVTVTALPAKGWTGKTPPFPLPQMLRHRWEYEEKRKFQVLDAEATEALRERELEIWAAVWKTPQAAAWSIEPWRWPAVSEFCRLKAVVEQEPDANAALVAQLHRYRDQIGMTPAGLKENGWAIAPHDAAATKTTSARKTTAAPKRRLRAAPADGRR